MYVTLPKDLSTQAEWWCAVNGHETPSGLDAMSEAECHALYGELTKLPNVLHAGLALWRARVDAGEYPQNGRKMLR